MRLLILTQKVDSNDSALGFFHRWIIEFAKHAEKVTVICLEEGIHSLPLNVKVYSLGKEKGNSKLHYLIRFYSLIFSLRNEYDSVFVHMNQIYVILGALLWKLWNKKIAMWYVHRQTNFSLWVSEKLADIIFTSSKESFQVPSNKVQYVGHGIDSQNFVCQGGTAENDKINILYVGRITAIKNLETLIDATVLLRGDVSSLTVTCVGSAVTESDGVYQEALEVSIQEKNLERVVRFKGSVSSAEIAKEYCRATLSVNLSPTGGWDKSVLESLTAGCPVFASNRALTPVFGEYADIFLFEQGNAKDLAQKIEAFLQNKDKDIIVKILSQNAIKKYDLGNLVSHIIDQLET